MRYAADGTLTQQDPRCEIVGGHSRKQNIVYNLGYPLTIDLISTGLARFTYIDVIGP